MSRTKPEALEETQLSAEVEPQPQVYRDTAYTSRTLILSGGRAEPVAKGRITATDDELLAYLNQHPDFEPLRE